MKLWTGDEWRPLSDNEAAHRLECGYIVLDDDDPRTAKNEAPAEPTDEPKETPAEPKEAADDLPRNNRKRR